MSKQNENIAFVRRGKTRTAAAASEMAKPYVEYAFLCAVVYDAPDNPVRLQDTAFLATRGWQQWQDAPIIAQPKDWWRYNLGGLDYEVWEKQELDGVTAAIVFRGTDGRDDWWSNLRWITRAVPFVRDHYMQVKYLTPRLIQAIDERHGKPIPILTSGHSLGGGLAQQAAYVSDHIKRVYAFNSTPVTGFYGVPDPPRRQNIKGIQIKRIYEHGEILAYVRRFMRLFNPLTVQDPEIIEIRFNLLGKMDAIGQHNMRKLAYNLKRKADEGIVAPQPALHF